MGLKYTILRDTHINELIVEVNKYISEGWQPLGNVVLTESLCIQAMIKHECIHRYNVFLTPNECILCGELKGCDHIYDSNSSSLNCLQCGKPKNHIDNTSTKD